jgi:aspartate/methionine/tyrosine aminotransferase
MAIMASESFTAVSAPIQYAACTAFTKHQEIDKYLNTSVAILKQLVDVIYLKISKTEIKIHKP